MDFHCNAVVYLLCNMVQWIEESEVLKQKGRMTPCFSIPCLSKEKEGFSKVSFPVSLSAIEFLVDDVLPRLGGLHLELISVMCGRFSQNHVWIGRFIPQNYKQVEDLLVSFFKELFQLQKIPHEGEDENDTLVISHLLLQDFLKFLEEFLSYDINCSDLSNVLKELKYMLPIFRDRPFRAVEFDQVQCLWEQFEGLINEAGSFVHSLFFNPNLLDRKFCEALPNSIELLKDNIIEFLRTLPNLSPSMIVYHDVDSFFIIHSLLHDLEDSVSRSDAPIVEIKDQIGGLHQGLMLAWSLLKEHLGDKEFKEIAVQIRDMAYGAEYVINSCLSGEIHVWYVKLSLTCVIHHIELIRHRLLEMNERSDGWALRSVSNTFTDKLSRRDTRSGTEVNDIIVGFEEEEQSMLEQLLGGTENLQRVGIVGTPGLGKTTLAKKLHNHPAVYDRFDKRSWCVVSQRYQRRDLLVNILKDLGEKVDILKDLGEKVEPDMEEAVLASRIHKTLKYRRFLITLDDIWNLDAWDDVRIIFPDDENGSRILFTSRNKDAAPSGSIINTLPLLSNDQCWELIKKVVFQGKACPPMLKKTGKEISAKCKGLPLVVTVIAGILSNVDKELEAWEDVEQDLELRDFLDQNKQVLQILELSYKHLLQHLKPCFLYFASFHEDERIPAKKLKQLWVAEGFIEKEDEEEKSVESIADEYLMELISKSLVMVVKTGSDGKIKTCVMHDLLHSMCLRIAEEEKFLKQVDGCCLTPYLECNRLLFKFPALYENHVRHCGSGTRSIFLDPVYYSNSARRLSFVNTKSLRVLDDKGHGELFRTFCDGTEHLYSMRYLAVSIGFPISFGSFFLKLEYLILDIEVYIPSEILKMPKLRYLKAASIRVDNDCKISQLPNNLEYLSVLNISDLKFIQLLKSTPHLRRLKFHFYGDSFCLDLDLRFLTQLESLSVSCSRTMKFEQIGIKFPSSIRKLSIWRLFYSWRNISIIGALPNLEVFKLQACCEEDTWNTSDSEFKKLRFLKLEDLPLCQWNISSSQQFPCLQQIVLQNLFYLEKIPSELGEIQTLQLIKVWACSESLVESAKEIEQEQHDFGNEDFSVIIDYF